VPVKINLEIANKIREDYLIPCAKAGDVYKKYNICKYVFYKIIKNKCWSISDIEYKKYLDRLNNKIINIIKETKICTNCGLEKNIVNDFHKNSSKLDGYSSWCKECNNRCHKEWMKSNGRNYRLNNKEKANKQAAEYANKKYKNNLNHKLRVIISSSVNKHLLDQGILKDNNSILQYLPYLIEDLKEHLEAQFLLPGNEWMNWNNWGKYNFKTWIDGDSSTYTWNIDHIKPHSDFPYVSMEDDLFIECWALENLRPYSAKQNILDGTQKTRHKKISITC
jgi:hypothetical protein